MSFRIIHKYKFEDSDGNKIEGQEESYLSFYSCLREEFTKFQFDLNKLQDEIKATDDESKKRKLSSKILDINYKYLKQQFKEGKLFDYETNKYRNATIEDIDSISPMLIDDIAVKAMGV